MPIEIRPTWERVVQTIQQQAGLSFSRQALSAHETIAQAYAHRLEEHRAYRDTGRQPRERDPEEDPSERRLREVEQSNHDLREHVEALEDLLIRLIQNAKTFGMTLEDLERPLEPLDQGRSDLDAMAKRSRDARRRSAKRPHK